MALNSDQLAAFLADVAQVAHETRAILDTTTRVTEAAKAAKADAGEKVEGLKRDAAGFEAPRFMGLAKAAGAFGVLYNDPDADGAKDVSMQAAATYLATMTGTTEKSLNGGRKSGAAALIRTGANGRVILERLQNRLNHWYSVLDTKVEGEDAGKAAERAATAKRYIQVADTGSDTKPAKHNGRPEVTVGGIVIKKAQSTNRDAQVAQAANLYAIHGNDFLADDVLDAFLDNGGRVEQAEETIGQRANRLGSELAAMLADCNDSPDGVWLKMAIDGLDRIKAQGNFTPSRAAAAASAPAGQAAPAQSPNLLSSLSDPDEVLSGEVPAAKPAKKRGGMKV